MDFVGIVKVPHAVLALGTLLLVAVEVAIVVAVVPAGEVPTYVIAAPLADAEAAPTVDCCCRI